LASIASGIGENPMDFQNIAGMLTGIGKMLQHPLETVDVPSRLILGRWFQVYKAAVNFDVYRTQMYCSIAYFKPNSVMGEDGFSIEEAYRVVSKHGSIETFKRDLNKVGAGRWWMYTEEYFYPRQFYIIKAGPRFSNESSVDDVNIQYLVVTDASRLGLSIYARDPIEYYQKYNKEVQTEMKEAGFGGKVYWNTPRPIYQGTDCDWPTEKEVFARRVLKNHDKQKASSADDIQSEVINGTTKDPQEVIGEILKNPQLTLQKFIQNMNIT